MALPHFTGARSSPYTEGSEVSMRIRVNRLHALQLAWVVLFALMSAGAQSNPDRQNNNNDRPNNDRPSNNQPNSDRPSPAAPGADYSGMYSFLRDGEFVQLTVEDQGHVIGFVSRYADPEAEGGFLEHFFKSGRLDGNQFVFTTETVHGVSFEFRGTVERGKGKSRGDEAYYMLKGTLVENSTDAAKKTSSRSSEVALKSFPQDLAPPQAEKK